MRRLANEPLIHFLVLGALAFLMYESIGGGEEASGGREIFVTQGRMEVLASQYEKTWQRPPTEAELDGMIDEYVLDEILYREAIAMGFDRDDTIIRRRLRQKVEFLSEDLLTPADPSDDELRSFLRANAERFRTDTMVDFKQVYLSHEIRGDRLLDDATDLLGKLRELGPAVDPLEFGDRLMLDPELLNASESEVRRLFGGEFADQLLEAPIHEWEGPIRSGFGLHLVYLGRRENGRVRELDEARSMVLREWQFEKQREATDAFHAELRERYTIHVERGGEASGDEPLEESGASPKSENPE